MPDPAQTQREEIEQHLASLLSDPIVAASAALLERFADQRAELIRALVAHREKQGLTQMQVAERMAISLVAVARLEAGLLDFRISTLEHYAAVISYDLYPLPILAL
jgi:ribosome-binding protein aMBF1 (putative translation factor)